MLALRNLRSSVFNDWLYDTTCHVSELMIRLIFTFSSLSRDEINNSHDKKKYIGYEECVLLKVCFCLATKVHTIL